MDGFVSAYAIATGKKQRIPRHWLDHPVFGPRFSLTPSARAAEEEAAAAADAEAAVNPRRRRGRTAVATPPADEPTDTQDADDTPSPDETPATGDTEEE